MDLKITIIISLWFICEVKSRHSEFDNYGVFRSVPYFIDKTEMLKLLFNSSLSTSENPYYFVTCPYNFGKMVNFLMIKQFAEIEIDRNNQPRFWLYSFAVNIFKDLEISRYSDIMMNHMARYPVIYLDLWVSKIVRIKNIPTMLTNALQESVEKYEWLADLLEKKINTVKSDFNIDKNDAKFFSNLFTGDVTDEELDNGLLSVVRVLYQYFNQSQVILLVDEYENVALRAFAAGNENGLLFYEKLNKMLIKTLTEGREYIKFALITGTGSLGFSMDEKKYNILGFTFGGTTKRNLITHYPFLDKHPFSPYYGFVEEQVSAICSLCRNGDGFVNTLLCEGYWTVDRRRIYNAASITDVYINTHRPSLLITPFYWIEPDFAKLIVPFWRSKVFRGKMEEADENGYFHYPIKKNFPSSGLKELIKLASNDFEQITRKHVDMFFTICFEQGYFTHAPGKDNFTFPNYNLKMSLRSQISELSLVHSKVSKAIKISEGRECPEAIHIPGAILI